MKTIPIIAIFMLFVGFIYTENAFAFQCDGSQNFASCAIDAGNAAEAAQATANTALTTANTAKVTADNAQISANNAQNTANKALQDIATEQQARITGDAATLNSANSYTDTRETAINQRTDNLITTEQQSRIDGIADEASKRIAGDTETLNSANSYTSQRETAINTRTDKLMDDEQQARIEGDRRTLSSANSYTDTRESVINQRTDNLMSDERTARIDGDRRTLSSANSYTNQRFSELNNKVNRNERRANGGISAAMAMSSIPYQIYVDNSFGMAAGTYRGETALAAGLQKQIAATTNVRLNVSWDTANSIGVAGGFAVGW
ncbi:YadA C-terminal domain-containing protein [Citrobacter freundii]|uniref:YadA C-terminal domain-containing protein n=1 Tax=Citrobacter freundii TaxID=546 RepID=UPI002FCDD5CD